MSETRTYFLVEYTRRDFVQWRSCDAIEDKSAAERKFKEDITRYPNLKHRMIRITVMRETK
jgi:phage pi2 protein 07